MGKRITLRHLLSLSIFFFLSLHSLPALSRTPQQGLPIEIEADRLVHEREGDTYTAQGRATIRWGGLRIEAERIIFKRAENRAIAIGNVVVTERRGIARGERLEIDFSKDTGYMEEGYIFYRPENLHIKGKELERLGEETYRVREGTFTTCDCSPPAWSFSSSDAKVTRGEYLVSKHTFFRIKDVPILYSPYVVIPVSRKRQTGFLMPGFGYSDLKGLSLYNAFFWAIDRSRDATFYLDYEANRGLGKGIQYRYIRKRGSEGEAFFYHYRERSIERLREYRTADENLGHPQDADRDRWLFTFKHRESLPFGIDLRADVAEVSDDEYFLDFWRDPDRRDRSDRDLQRLESNLTLSKGWGRWSLVTQFRYFDDLLKEDDDDTLQRLPQVDLTVSGLKLWNSPLYFSMESSGVNFYRQKGIDGFRLDLHPSLSFPLRPWDLFEVTPKVGVRETRYWVSEGDRTRSRELYDLSLDLQTTLVRIFSRGERRFRHTIRPEISYSYIPFRDQGHLPSFDEIDRIEKENKVTYSITSILTGRRMEDGRKIYHDYLYLRLSQSFDINEARRAGGNNRPFSEITGELNLYPTDLISMGAKGEFDPYSRYFKKYILTTTISDRRGDRFSAGYNYTRGSDNYIDLSLDLTITRGLKAFHRSRFSHYKPLPGDDRIKTLETVFGVRYQSQCWGIEIARIERPDERLVTVTINLLGLGEVLKPRLPF